MTDAGGTTYFVLDGATVVADVSAAGTAERFYNYYPGSYRLHSMREGSDG